MRTRTLRSRLRRTQVGLAASALVLLGLPLGVAVQRVVNSEALSVLQRDAARTVAAVPDEALEQLTPTRLPNLGGSTSVGVYDTSGRRVAGDGPPTSALSLLTADGAEHHGHEAAQLVVVVPVVSDGTVAGSVRAARSSGSVRASAYKGWAALAGLVILVLALTLLAAARVSRRIAQPFEQLTEGARELGEGVFVLSVPTSGISEADTAASALRRTAEQMGQLVRQERDFVRHASHQLRTPLAGLLLQLEKLAMEGDSRAAVARARG